MNTKLRLMGAGLTVALAGTLAACGGSGTSAASGNSGTSAASGTSPASATTTAPASSSSSAAASSGSSTSMTDFGSACSAVPSSGAGSFGGMATAPVATAASHNPVLSTLVTAVTKAGLVDTLNNAKAITVFAPANSAFAKIPAATLNSVLANKSELTSLLEYHVLPGRLSPSQLAGTHKTLEGSNLTVTGSGTSFTVNGASQVVCGNVQTANATVYIVSSVLMPPAASSSAG